MKIRDHPWAVDFGASMVMISKGDFIQEFCESHGSVQSVDRRLHLTKRFGRCLNDIRADEVAIVIVIRKAECGPS